MKKRFQYSLALALCAVLFLSENAFAQWQGYGGRWGMGPGMMNWGYGMGWFGTIIMAAFWIVVIIGIVFLIRWLVMSASIGSHGVRSEESAFDILKKRYARGEINKDEFEEKKKDLL